MEMNYRVERIHTGRGKGRLALILLLIAGLVVSLLSGCTGKEKVEEVVKVPVEVYLAKNDIITRTISLSGVTEPEVTAMVMPEIMGAQMVRDVPVKVGDVVRPGTVLAFLDAKNVTLNYEIAERAYLDAQANYERNKALYEAGAIARVQFEQVESGYLQAKNSFEMRKIELSNYSIKSPIAGVVSAVNVTAGNMASPQSPAAIVSKVDTLLIKTSVNEKEAGRLQVGQEVQVVVPSMNNQEFPGKIRSIAPTMDLQIRAYPVQIEIPNPGLAIQPGTFARAEIEVERREDVIVIPTEAVIVRGNQARVFVIQEEKAQSLIVETGLSNPRYTEITAGLKSGDQVITRGNDNVVIGDLVRIVQPIEVQIQQVKEEAAGK